MHADSGVWVWVVIMVIVGISKLAAKAKEFSASAPEADSKPPPPPPARPKPRPLAQRPPVPHLGPRVAQPQGPRRVEPQRRITATATSTPSAAQPAAPGKKWNVSLDDLQTFLERMQQAGQPPVVPAVPPPLVEAAAPPVAEPAPKAEAPPAPEPVKAQAPLAASTNRGALWNQALRDKANLRNVILSVEILGPPRALRPLER